MDLLALSLLVLSPAPQQPRPEPGISRELAHARAAAIAEPEYRLRFELRPEMKAVEGEVLLQFEWSTPRRDLVVDFEGERAWGFQVNGTPVAAGRIKSVHDHLVVPSNLLRRGRNQLRMRFRSKVASTGTPLNVYVDSTDEQEYYYTLVVPADAHRLFPCFDQPDLKGRFRLELEHPDEWRVVANSPLLRTDTLREGRSRSRFNTTPPISTYLFAFAAGPFEVLSEELPHCGHTLLPMARIYYRASQAEHLQAEHLLELHGSSVAWLEEYFGVRYPFEKLDMVLAPGFPYRGMEHPGAIFYRESSLVFDHEPTELEEVTRSTLIYHEVTHQWFGNLVTMEWFDDLWLKEGFATFLSYALLEDLEPERLAWLRFHQRVKPRAYRVDVTPGTVPVWQELGNLADAKSAYGPIVYNKAPAVLHELDERMGEASFRAGVHAFLEQYGWANARWDQLIEALREASKAPTSDWSERWSRSWILTAGMPQLRAVWTTDADDRVVDFVLRQSGIQDSTRQWSLRVELLAAYADGERRRHLVELEEAEIGVPALTGQTAPRWVLLNPRDVAYGQFLLDERSLSALMEDLPAEQDPLIRAVGFSALFETTREAELAPERFAEFGLRMLEQERDALTHQQILTALITTIGRYLPPAKEGSWRRRLSDLLWDQLEAGELPGLELQTFRVLPRLSPDARTLRLCRALLDDEARIPGLELGTRDRFLALAALIGAGEPDADERLQAISADGGEDVAKQAFLIGAAAPEAAVKQSYFETYLDPAGPPEQWVEESLEFFHWPGQEALTEPYLSKALDQVPWVKAHRKIFFMPAWVDAFVNAHNTGAALEEVEGYLERAQPSLDIRRKVLQSLDGLRRAVRIQARN